MPDLDQIKQGEQELGTSAGGSPRGRSGNPAGRAAAATTSTATARLLLAGEGSR